MLCGDETQDTSSFLFSTHRGLNNLAVISKLTGATIQSLSADIQAQINKITSEEPSNSQYNRKCFQGIFGRHYVPVATDEYPEMQMSSSKVRMARYLAAALCLFFLLAFGSALIPPPGHPWQRFSEVEGSTGPRYQLQLKPDNVTAWASAQAHIETDWFLRIDDGAVYPRKLLQDKETEYQEWLYDRYPEVNSVRTSGKYLDPDYLSHPEVKNMLIDKYFHISHCVYSMRRYWIAKETGKLHHFSMGITRCVAAERLRASYMPYGSQPLAHEPLL